MHVEVDYEKCCGAGTCVVNAPEVFDQDDDEGTVVLLDADPSEDQRSAVENAVAMCPVRAITIATVTHAASTTD
jgi:ferredoxin